MNFRVSWPARRSESLFSAGSGSAIGNWGQRCEFGGLVCTSAKRQPLPLPEFFQASGSWGELSPGLFLGYRSAHGRIRLEVPDRKPTRGSGYQTAPVSAPHTGAPVIGRCIIARLQIYRAVALLKEQDCQRYQSFRCLGSSRVSQDGCLEPFIVFSAYHLDDVS
jgi:hypothetical protein